MNKNKSHINFSLIRKGRVKQRPSTPKPDVIPPSQIFKNKKT
jgi:hypothetical protein